MIYLKTQCEFGRVISYVLRNTSILESIDVDIEAGIECRYLSSEFRAIFLRIRRWVDLWASLRTSDFHSAAISLWRVGRRSGQTTTVVSATSAVDRVFARLRASL